MGLMAVVTGDARKIDALRAIRTAETQSVRLVGRAGAEN
jgi:hypothetical protein